MSSLTIATAPSLPAAQTIGTEKVLWQGAFFCLALVPVTILAMLIDPRELNGINLWIKPLKFQLSVGLHIATLALFARFIDDTLRDRIGVRILAWAISGFGIFEIAYITIQAGRGRHSHFNLETPMEASMYSLMGIGAVTLIMGAAVVGWLAYRRPAAGLGQGLRTGILAGLSLGFVTTLAVAGYMSGGTGHWVGGPTTDANGLPIVGWARGGGDLRVPHFFATHLMQAIPFVGWVADRKSSHPTRWVYTACVLGLVVIAATFVQALMGMPLI
ncbi:MAG: hypothetical protein RIM33_13260 [Alphaproteobacteria bacterium]